MRIFLLVIGLAVGYFAGFRDGRADKPSAVGRFVADMSPDSNARVKKAKESAAAADARTREALTTDTP